MAATPETIARHELVGLRTEVVAAANPDVVGIEGTVVTETAQTLGVEGPDRVRYVPKEAATFVFDLEGQRVRVDGSKLVARPAERTERRSDSTWR